MEKICFVLANYFKYYKGGAELQAYLIAKQSAQNIEVHYIFMKHPNFNKTKFQKIDHGIILHPMKHYVYKMFGKLFFLNYWELIRLLDDINPDLIYQRGGKTYLGFAARWCKKNNKKLVVGISSDSNCSKKVILNWNINFLSFPAKIMNGFFTIIGTLNANLIITQTHFQQKLLRQNFNRDSMVIPNGLPVPSPPFKKADPPVISWIANIKPLKKLEIFIKLAENLQDLNVQFVYAGRLSEGSNQDMLMEKTKKLSNLTYLSEISLENTNELLSKSSLFVNTSLALAEGFPNTYIQAWMRETPVVTLNCDPDDVIKSQRLGFHSGSFEDLVRDVRYLIENEDVRGEMGEKARKYAINNYDIDKIGKKYFKVFESLLN